MAYDMRFSKVYRINAKICAHIQYNIDKYQYYINNIIEYCAKGYLRVGGPPMEGLGVFIHLHVHVL